MSEEAKDHAREAIDELEQSPETQETRQGYEEDKDETRVNAGYKATMKSEHRIDMVDVRGQTDVYARVDPNVSEEAKEHARELLDSKGAI